MKLIFRIATLFLAILSTALVGADAFAARRPQAAWSGVVIYVVDGDTVRVRPPGGGKPVSIRLEGIDAPEICQSGGTLSREALQRRVHGQRVAVYGRARDDYGRVVARVNLNGEDQGRWMVANGYAWSYRYRRNAGPYAVEQRGAELAKVGIFAVNADRPVNPREFRKRHGSCWFYGGQRR